MNSIFKSFGEYLFQVLLSLDQLFNTILGGMADESLSSRAWRMENKNKKIGKILRPVIDGIIFWDEDHCYNSFISEVKRRQLPRSFQEA